jgi:hypothetical protein
MWVLPLPIAEGGEAAAAEESPAEAALGPIPVHEGIYCDGCRMPAIIGPRFK